MADDLRERDNRDRVTGTYHDAEELDRKLQASRNRFHLISPATTVGALPVGCGVTLSAVLVNVEGETYDVQGRRGLSKPALDRIALAAGVSWNPQLSGRVDDGTDPRYCRYRVTGLIRGFDGAPQAVQGEKEVDLREGSQALKSLTPKQVKEMRLHISAHAETKARMRAIRSLGLRTAYEAEELSKPFVIARVVFTGHTDDPELKREFARMTAQSFMGASAGLFGAPALPMGNSLGGTFAPPPIDVNGEVVGDDDDDNDGY